MKIIDPISENPIWWDSLELPFIFLGFEIKHNHKSGEPNWLETKVPTHKLMVQCGGYACNQKNFQGFVYRPEKWLENMQKLSDEYLASCIHNYNLTSLQTYVEYSDFLEMNFRAGCDNSFYKLLESIYPVDAEFCPTLIGRDFEEELAKMVDIPDDKSNWKDLGYWMEVQKDTGLYIFGENCD